MKRILFAFFAFLSLLVAFAQLQEVLPLSVQNFMDECAQLHSLSRSSVLSDKFQNEFAAPRIVDGVEMVDAFIDIDNRTVVNTLKNRGIKVDCEFDGFVVARIPMDILNKVSQIPGVSNVEIGRTLELCTDSTLSQTHAGQVLNGPDYGLPQVYDGTGVIIGIIDSGFEYQHYAFRSSEDPTRTRIVRVYDTANETGHPVYNGTEQFPGSVFMGEQIDTLTYDTRGSHGTHTTSIASGMHVNGYGGMAPGAEIVLCSVRDMDVSVSEPDVVRAMTYIYSYADSVGKPCVISLSMSAKDGPHDGSDRISQAVAQLTGPSRIFVIAAGNNGNIGHYTYGPVTAAKPLNMLLSYQSYAEYSDFSYYYKKMWFETWVRNTNERITARFHIFDKYTKRIVWESDIVKVYKQFDSSLFSQYFAPDPSVDNLGYLKAFVSKSNTTNKYELYCAIYNLKSKEYTVDSYGYIRSRYQIGVTVYPPSSYSSSMSDSCYVDSWLCTGLRGTYDGVVYVDEISENGDTITQAVSDFYARSYNSSSINPYAVHDSIISAGGYVGRTSYNSINYGVVYDAYYTNVGSIYYASSYQDPGSGPTGEHLPIVMAPGYSVAAAVSRNSSVHAPGSDYNVMNYNGYLWGVMSGTSMASPTVAGIIAQWLQIEPNLSPSDVKNIIAQTAIKDQYTQDPVDGHRFGPNGKIDAMAGVRYLLALNGDDDVLLGDVDGNGIIKITDLVALVNYLLGNEDGSNLVLLNADVNQDGRITIWDATKLIDILLGKE